MPCVWHTRSIPLKERSELIETSHTSNVSDCAVFVDQFLISTVDLIEINHQINSRLISATRTHCQSCYPWYLINESAIINCINGTTHDDCLRLFQCRRSRLVGNIKWKCWNIFCVLLWWHCWPSTDKIQHHSVHVSIQRAMQNHKTIQYDRQLLPFDTFRRWSASTTGDIIQQLFEPNTILSSATWRSYFFSHAIHSITISESFTGERLFTLGRWSSCVANWCLRKRMQLPHEQHNLSIGCRPILHIWIADQTPGWRTIESTVQRVVHRSWWGSRRSNSMFPDTCDSHRLNYWSGHCLSINNNIKKIKLTGMRSPSHFGHFYQRLSILNIQHDYSNDDHDDDIVENCLQFIIICCITNPTSSRLIQSTLE